MTTKECSACNQTLPLEEFYLSSKYSSSGKEYRYSQCRTCHNKKMREKYDPIKRKSNGLKYNYGLTIEEYNQKLEKQDYGCAICGIKIPGGNGKHFYVDHNHSTGQVRDLLCHNCNFVIGYAKEDIDILKAVIRYLEIWGDESSQPS